MSHSLSDTSTPNYYAVIIAPVRYCKDLEPNAKLLYGEISALANQEGYCWASNKYFAELYDVDERTIKRWLESLKDKNFIEVQIDRNGFQASRKIYISQNIFTKGQKCPGGGTKMSRGGDKNVPYNNTYNNTKNKQQQKEQAAAASLEDEKNAKKMFEASKIFAKNRDAVWQIPIELFLRLVVDHGMEYVRQHASHMCKQQQRAEKDEKEEKKKKTPKVDDPMKYLIRACAENWAESSNNKKEKNEH